MCGQVNDAGRKTKEARMNYEGRIIGVYFIMGVHGKENFN